MVCLAAGAARGRPPERPRLAAAGPRQVHRADLRPGRARTVLGGAPGEPALRGSTRSSACRGCRVISSRPTAWPWPAAGAQRLAQGPRRTVPVHAARRLRAADRQVGELDVDAQVKGGCARLVRRHRRAAGPQRGPGRACKANGAPRARPPPAARPARRDDPWRHAGHPPLPAAHGQSRRARMAGHRLAGGRNALGGDHAERRPGRFLTARRARENRHRGQYAGATVDYAPRRSARPGPCSRTCPATSASTRSA